MKREDLKSILPDASDDIIDQIMKANGADINAAKGSVSDLKKQLSDALAANEALKASSKEDELAAATKKLSDLQAELDTMKAAETTRAAREKVAADKKIPANLLTGSSEEECAAQADAILAFAKPAYPNLPDGGEISQTGSGSGSTADAFFNFINEIL